MSARKWETMIIYLKSLFDAPKNPAVPLTTTCVHVAACTYNDNIHCTDKQVKSRDPT